MANISRHLHFSQSVDYAYRIYNFLKYNPRGNEQYMGVQI